MVTLRRILPGLFGAHPIASGSPSPEGPGSLPRRYYLDLLGAPVVFAGARFTRISTPHGEGQEADLLPLALVIAKSSNPRIIDHNQWYFVDRPFTDAMREEMKRLLAEPMPILPLDNTEFLTKWRKAMEGTTRG